MKLIGRCVEKVEEDTWLLATENGAILMKTDQELKAGSTMTFVKPKEVEKKIFSANKAFKAARARDNISIEISEKEKSKLCAKMGTVDMKSGDKPEVKIFNDINSVDVVGNTVKNLIGKVKRTSGEILNKKGTGRFKIIDLKDIVGDDISLTLYKNLPEVEVGDIVQVKDSKVSNFKKDGEKHFRLQTMQHTKMEKLGSEMEEVFKEVALGSVKVEVKVIGVTSLNTYLSCKKCRKQGVGKCLILESRI